MSYAAAIDQLNAMVPELYQSADQPRRKFSLDEIRVLLAALGNPHLRFPSVLIAGTNGKGSTAATLASILTASGLRVGLYTSPHLARINERMRIGDVEISDDSFAATYFRVHDAAQNLVLDGALPQLPSFFEILTAQALLYFAEAHIEIAVLEVGLGGRLDATNIVEPIVSVITDIALDHTEWLGPTITAIAREKAGILRLNGTLVTLPQHPEANQVFGEVAEQLSVRGVSAVPYMPGHVTGAYAVQALGAPVWVDSPLTGSHQHRNVALAIATAIELVETHKLPVTPAAIEAGVRQTRWPARMERIETEGIAWILDVAHNPAGAWALRAALKTELGSRDRLPLLIFSCLRDKPIAEMAQILFPLFDEVVIPPIRSARAADVELLLQAAAATGTEARSAGSAHEALQFAMLAIRQKNSNNPAVVISGSVYLVGEARSLLLPEAACEQATP